MEARNKKYLQVRRQDSFNLAYVVVVIMVVVVVP